MNRRDDPRKLSTMLLKRPAPPTLGAPIELERCTVEYREFQSGGKPMFRVFDSATGELLSACYAVEPARAWAELCHVLGWFPLEGLDLGDPLPRDPHKKRENKPPGETLPDLRKEKRMPAPDVPVSPAAPCNYCPASIRWLRTRCDKKMPVDAIPETRITMDGRVVPLWVPHWASCPGASQARARAAANPDGPTSAEPEASDEPNPQLGLGI